MPTSKQKRQAAQRHLQRQLERRQALARKRRQRNVILAAALAVLVVIGAVFLFATLGNDDEGDNTATPTPTVPTTSETPTTPAVPGECTFIPGDPAAPNVTDVGVPSSPAPTEGTVELAVTTTQGDMTFTLDRALAPCAVQSFTYLAAEGFYNDSPCHRMVNQDTFGVLQCGDPSGTGSGGPGYTYSQEAPAGDAPYAKGVIAMANSGAPDTTGSQFFIMFVDTDLPPQYSVIGSVTAGIDVVEKVAAEGNDGSFDPSPGGGAPVLPITLETITALA